MITEDHRKQLDQLLTKCVEHDNLLSDWENSFVSDFIDKLEEYQEKILVSRKQQAIFDRLAEKLEKAGVM